MLRGVGILYTRKNAQVVTIKTYSRLVTMLFQQLVNRMCSHCLFPVVDKLSTACSQLATRLLSSTDLLQVVPTTCYRPAIQQVVSDNFVAT
jgi:hypothetical protein